MTTIGGSSRAAVASEVARLFFDRQLSKVEIGNRLGISRFRVARLIDQALSEDLVRIEFREIPALDRQRAARLERAFGLDLCVVASAGPVDGPVAVDAVARLAGSVTAELIDRDDVVGIAWGSTLAAVVAAMPARADGSIEVVQLAGSSVGLDRRGDPGELARALADRLGAADRPLHAPAFVDDPALRAALVTQPDLAATVGAFDRLTIAIVGIGAMPTASRGGDSSLIRSGALGPADVERLVGLGAVGDLIVHPFDLEGRFVAPDLGRRAIAVSVEQLRRVPRVVAVAAGPAKGAAIRGALATGVLDVLVTDAAAADAALAAQAPSRPVRRPRARRRAAS